MTPKATDPLTPANATGDVTADLIRLSTTVIVKVDGLAKEMGRRFSETNRSIAALDSKVDKVDGRVGTIEQSRVIEAALALQAKALETAQTVKDQKASDERIDAAASHTLTDLQRKALWVAGLGGVAGAIDVLAHVFGYWH